MAVQDRGEHRGESSMSAGEVSRPGLYASLLGPRAADRGQNSM